MTVVEHRLLIRPVRPRLLCKHAEHLRRSTIEGELKVDLTQDSERYEILAGSKRVLCIRIDGADTPWCSILQLAKAEASMPEKYRVCGPVRCFGSVARSLSSNSRDCC